jgi:hypothetical protein
MAADKKAMEGIEINYLIITAVMDILVVDDELDMKALFEQKFRKKYVLTKLISLCKFW